MKNTIPAIVGRMSVMSLVSLAAGVALLVPASPAGADYEGASSLINEVMVLPAPGKVVVDGNEDHWDLSAGVWCYNDPAIVDRYSVWVHMMWDERGVYLLARYADRHPMQNAVMGKNFSDSWKADCFQGRVIFDDGTPREHEMHINMFYSTPEKRPYMIIHHGGFGDGQTGPARPDLAEKLGDTMDAAGGKIAFKPWADGKGYNMEAFWPWKYCRLGGEPLKAGEQFVFGIEAMWGNADGTWLVHRLADCIKNEKVDRTFMFCARTGWGRAVLCDKGRLDITEKQKLLQAARLKKFFDYDTYGTAPITYSLAEDRDVTIAIDDANGRRVRNLFGQYPRNAGKITDRWDCLDDAGKPVPAGQYKATVVDHKPIEVKLVNSLFNAATPPWATETGSHLWGANHGHPSAAATDGNIILIGFNGVEGTTGLLRCDGGGKILWTDVVDVLDVTMDAKCAYELSTTGWIGKTLVQRLNLATGKIIPFEDEQRSVYATVREKTGGVPETSTIAASDGKLFILMPGQELYRMDPVTGRIEATVPAGDLLAITARNGKLFALCEGGGVWLLGTTCDKIKKLTALTGLARPLRLGVSQDETRFAVSDAGTNQVRVFDGFGKPVVALGKAFDGNDRPAGAFVETDLIRPLGAAFDSMGRLWVAEASGTTRRVTLWSPSGELLRQFWGGADYGAMSGFAITFDSTRFIAHGLEFNLDPNPDPCHRPTAEKAIAYHPCLVGAEAWFTASRAMNTPCRCPATTARTASSSPSAGRTVCSASASPSPMAIPGPGGQAPPGLTWATPAARTRGGVRPSTMSRAPRITGAGWCRDDMTIITADQYIYAPTGFTPGGTPIYDFANPTRPASPVPVDLGAQGSTGTVVMDSAGDISTGIDYMTADGRRGTYPNPYGRHDAPAAQRGLLIAPFRTNGVVEGLPGVGSITALGGDRGQWFILTMNGLYLSAILQDCKADYTLDETLTGGESFGGFIWRDEKGRVLAQLGGASYRIMQVLGLDTCRKQTIPLAVTDAQIAEGFKIAFARRSKSSSEPDELKIARLPALPSEPVAPQLDPNNALIPGAEEFRVQQAGDPSHWWRAAMAHDGTRLAIMFQVRGSTPWKNGESRFTHAFIGGDCVDFKFDLPGRGPQRLLAAPLDGADTAVLWRVKADKKVNPQGYAVDNNPAGATSFDVVRRCDAATVSHKTAERAYSVLMVVPLAELGVDSSRHESFPGVVGVIYSDPSGTNRTLRLYWHDKQTGLVNDVPGESRLDTKNWGTIRLEK